MIVQLMKFGYLLNSITFPFPRTVACLSGKPAMQVLKLKPTLLTPENFRPYGQVIGPSVDGALFGSDDAQLHLSAGIPRFYIMRLENRPLKFSNITHHASVSQCLGSIGALPWYIGVAKPSIVQHQDEKSQENKERDASAENIVQSHVGHYYVPPDPMEVKVFRVEGPQFLKFNVGTWHAGPLFKEQMMDFYNLELSNTNEVDHTTHKFDRDNKIIFVIDD